MSRKQYKDTDYFYEVVEDGYDIFQGEIKIITQHDPYGKVFDPNGSYEENCLLQLDQMTAPKPEPPAPGPTPEEMLRADVDYIAIMEDLTLPSQESEEEGE